MNYYQPNRWVRLRCFALIALQFALWPIPGPAQFPLAPPTTPQAQHNALLSVRSQVDWFINSTRTATNYGEQGYGNVWQMFQGLRQSYFALKQTLNPQQLAYGANNLADLDAGLDIIEEGFSNYQQDVAEGRQPGMALQAMCRVMRQAIGLWLQELNKTSFQLRIG
jgi:hypothetical protein